MDIIKVDKKKIMETKNLIIKMTNGNEYYLYNTKESILRTRNFDDMNFIEIDNTIAREIVYVRYYYNFRKVPPINTKEKVLSRASINVKNIVSINYID